MRRVAYLLLSLAACLSFLTAAGIASDWVEESPSYNRVPRPAPPIKRSSTPDLDAAESGDEEQPEWEQGGQGGDGSHHVKQSPGGRPRLEANVSKWGAVNSPQRGPMSGSAMESFRQPGSAGRTLQGSAEANMFAAAAQQYVPPRKQSVSPSVFRGFVEKTHPSFALKTSTMSRNRVVEVKGQWDQSSRTIRALEIPHTRIAPRRLLDYPLDDVQVLVINCAGRVPHAALQRIRDFVARGGYLISTDWTLDGVVRRAFPGYIEWNRGQTNGRVVDGIVVSRDRLLLKGTPPVAGWKLDEGSQTVRVIRRSAVRVLVRSRQLMYSGDDPDGEGILACAFPFGRGRVLHLVGHFDNNSGSSAHTSVLPDPAPGIGISLRQAIATNFLIAALADDRPENAASER